MTFEKWRDSLSPDHWARYDLSACKLGWDARQQEIEQLKTRIAECEAENKKLLSDLQETIAKSASIHRPVYDEQQKKIAELEKCLIGQQQSTETAHKKIECLKSRIAELEALKTPSLPVVTAEIYRKFKSSGLIDFGFDKIEWTQDAVDFLCLCSKQPPEK